MKKFQTFSCDAAVTWRKRFLFISFCSTVFHFFHRQSPPCRSGSRLVVRLRPCPFRPSLSCPVLSCPCPSLTVLVRPVRSRPSTSLRRPTVGRTKKTVPVGGGHVGRSGLGVLVGVR